MARCIYLVLVALASAACGAASVLDAPAGGGAAPPSAARCAARGEAVAVVGSTMPPLVERARFPVDGSPWFAAEGGTVYWVSYSAAALFTGPTTIEGHALVLGETAPRQLWRQTSDGNRSLAGRLWTSGPDLTWLEYFPAKPPTNGALYTAPRAGGSPTVLLDRLQYTDLHGGLRLLGTDAERVYLSPIAPVGISTITRMTGQMTSAIATTAPPTLLAIEDDFLYWVEGDELWRARRDGSRAGRLASGVMGAKALAVHDGVSWVVAGEGPQQRLARVTAAGAAATCTVVAPWSDGGRDAQLLADANGLYIALSEASGQTADAVWWIRPDGRGTWRLLGAEDGRVVRLLAGGQEGLLVAVSVPGGWAIARLPTGPQP